MPEYTKKAQIMDEAAISRAVRRMAFEIIEKNRGTQNLYLIGIQRRGVILAQRIAKQIAEIEGVNIPVGVLDITFYRDDLTKIKERGPVVSDSAIPESIEGKTVILVDDVIFTGRTVRAALDALIAFGRPAKIQLAEMVDRGHREVPIRADYVGKNIPTSKNEVIRVKLAETDGVDAIEICEL